MIDIKKVGQDQAQLLKQAADKDQLSHAYLLAGNDEELAVNTAYWLICYLNCTGVQKPDGTCANCRRILEGNHPDIRLVDVPDKRQTISIDQVRELKQELMKRPAEGTYRFFIINHAQALTLPAANGLLNLLEEPIAPVITFLVANNVNQILPTVKSRTQIINFSQVQVSDRTSFLLENGLSQEEIDLLGETAAFDRQLKSFYQELQGQDSLSLITAHQLAASVKKQKQASGVLEKYVWIMLKRWADEDLDQAALLPVAASLLIDLMKIDQMRQSNVNFLSSLDYLALQRQK